MNHSPPFLHFHHKTAFNMSITAEILLVLAKFTAGRLAARQEDLASCKWTDGESNLDSYFSRLACACTEDSWTDVLQQFPELVGFTIVANGPDIHIAFFKDGVKVPTLHDKIELKSSTSPVLPGSTIGKLDINQPLIYCHRPKQAVGLYDIRYGQYHTAMGESEFDLFQDRTPRPPLSFNKLTLPSMESTYCHKKNDSWIDHYGKCAVRRVTQAPPKASWQDALVKNILLEALQGVETLEDLIALKASLQAP